jgi:hypothetical protein
MSQKILLLLSLAAAANAQEASSGFDLRATVSEQVDYTHQLSAPPRDGDPLSGGFRAMLYPTWKLSEHWFVSGAVQIHSRPYFSEEYTTQGYGVRADVLQGYLGYSRFWRKGSVTVRAGELSSAFGSFLLRYDDATNALIALPLAYGYYYKPVSDYGLAGAQVDVTLGKLDMRAQFANSSPANRRSIFDDDQYGNWAGGAGWTIRQGLRVGVSGYRGPYLDRDYPFFFPGEANPSQLPATAGGVDVEWASGPWNVYGEWQRFLLTYRAIPNFREDFGYAEVKRVLHPRWYVAARVGYGSSNEIPHTEVYEAVVGYRPARNELIKLGYEVQRGPDIRGSLNNVLAVQFVTTLHPISVASR